MNNPTRKLSDDRLPLMQKLLFCIGVNVDYVSLTVLTGIMWIPFFNIGYGISPGKLGFILMMVRILDIVTNPVMGGWSDNVSTRWGRRKPLMLFGVVTTALLFPAFWFLPPHWSESSQVAYLITLGIIYFTCHTVWSLAYYSLHLELTSSYDERTSISAWMTFCNKFAYLGGGWLLAFVSSSVFLNPKTGKGDLVIGMQSIAWYLAGLMLVFGLLPTFFTRERKLPAEIVRRPKVTIWEGIRDSARCQPLWALVGIMLFLTIGYSAVWALGNYIYIYYLFGGSVSAGSQLVGYKTTITMVAGLASLPLLTWLSARYEKRLMVTVMLVICIIGHLLNYVCLNPAHPYWMLFPAVLESCGISAIGLFLPAMKGDVADYDELNTHHRREGSINAFYSLLSKLAATISTGLSGLLIDVAGFQIKAPLQSPEVLHRMVLWYVIVPIAVWVIAIVINYSYPLTRIRMVNIRSTLEDRRGRI